jgi:hypothetical protein
MLSFLLAAAAAAAAAALVVALLKLVELVGVRAELKADPDPSGCAVVIDIPGKMLDMVPVIFLA